jgi:uncharacterized protein (TIRG00374 family)
MGDVLDTVASANVFLCVLGYGCVIVFNVLQGVQLYYAIARFAPQTGLMQMVRLQFISGFYAVILPSQLTTSVVKWHRMSRGKRLRAQSAAVVIYIRVLNGVAIMAWAIPGILFDKQINLPLVQWTAGLLAATVLLGATPIFVPQLAQPLARMLSAPLRVLPLPKGIRQKLAKVWNSLLLLNDMERWRVGLLLFIAFFFQLFVVLHYYWLCLAVGVHLPIVSICWLHLLIFLITALPISVAGIGIREATMVGILPVLYGVSRNDALAVSLLFAARYLVPLIVGGGSELYEWIRGARVESEGEMLRPEPPPHSGGA